MSLVRPRGRSARTGPLDASRVPAPKALRSFLANARRPTGTLSYHEVQGFLFAIASAPEMARPSEWMPMIFGEGGPEY